jgi:acetyl-CoA carboxylase biotin carboxyl carrier protein
MSRTKKSFDEDLIRNLANLLKETDLTEIEIEQDDFRIRIARQVLTETIMGAPAAAAPHGPPAAPAEAAEHPGTVKSPMVGTAYRSPAPGTDAFVEIGSQVSEGQTIMIIEAMKTMNHIPAPRAGTVTAILVNDGHPVEFGEPLMIIE